MKVSVILPVYNEEKYIEQCLISIIKQSRQPDEIIVIDDGSTDNSKVKIQKLKLQLKVQNLILLQQKHQGTGTARNLGAKKARGEILVSLDADMTYDNKYIETLVKPIISGKEIATTAGNETVANMDNIWANFWDHVTYASDGKRVKMIGPKRDETFRAIRRDEFLRAGGFENLGHCDDTTVLKKIGKTAKCMSLAICYHYNPSTLSEVFYSARWMGRDASNRGNYLNLLIYSPFWSFIKAFVGVVKFRNMNFLPFRLIFDFGYLVGLQDLYIRNITYK